VPCLGKVTSWELQFLTQENKDENTSEIIGGMHSVPLDSIHRPCIETTVFIVNVSQKQMSEILNKWRRAPEGRLGS
jgi:hypothetical protein